MCDTKLLNYRINVTKNGLPFEDHVVVDSVPYLCATASTLTSISTADLIEVNAISQTLPFNLLVFGSISAGVNEIYYSANTDTHLFSFTAETRVSTYYTLVWDNTIPDIGSNL